MSTFTTASDIYDGALHKTTQGLMHTADDAGRSETYRGSSKGLR